MVRQDVYRVPVRDANRVRAGLVVQMVAVATGLTPEIVLDVRRCEPDVRQARRTAMYLAHVAYGWTLERVGHAFGRNRVTVGAACRKVEDERDLPDIDARIEAMTAALQGLIDATDAGR